MGGDTMDNAERETKIHEIKDKILETLAKENFDNMALCELKKAIKILHHLKEE